MDDKEAEKLLNLPEEELARLPSEIRGTIENLRKQIFAARRLQAMRTAQDDLLEFTRSMMPHPDYPDDSTQSLYEVKPVHEYIARKLEAVERGEILRLIISVQPRIGKALEVNTPVPTPDGWRRIADLKPGDCVFDHLGRPTPVTAVSPVWKARPVYRVKTDDNGELLTDAAHEWLGRKTRYSGDVIFTSEELCEAFEHTGRRAKITPQAPLELPEADLPVDPYVLGLWLGDGSSHGATMSGHPDDIAFIRREVELAGYETSDRATADTFGVLGLQKQLREMGLLGNKHVPAEYLRASRAQRLALVQGLVDTDGHVEDKHGRTEVTFTNERLAEGLQELVRSLGIKCSRYESEARLDGRYISQRWRMTFLGRGLARLPRRAMKQKDPDARPDRYISAEPAGYGDTVCIEVASPDHLFLAGREMIPTHNSELSTKKFPAWLVGRNPYRQVITVGYGEEFVRDFGAEVRDTLASQKYRQIFPRASLKKGQASVNRQKLKAGGVLNFVGVGGSITGRGADFAIIDDPIKGDKESLTQQAKDEMWSWYTKVLLTRMMGKANAQVITMTRWAEDDLVGRLTNPDLGYVTEKQAAQWTVINLPAEAEEDDPLGRNVGEVLWPERTSKEFLENFRALDPDGYASLYLGRPSPPEGNHFLLDHMKTYAEGELPGNLRYYAASDHAVSEKQGRDKTCMGVVGVDEQDNIYVMSDLVWAQIPTDTQVETMLGFFSAYPILDWWAERPHYEAIAPFLRKRMAEENIYGNVVVKHPIHDKLSRSQAIRSRMAQGKVYFPRHAPWWADAKSQMLNFPNDAHDDFVDFISWIGRGLVRQVRPDSVASTKKKGPPKTGTLDWLLAQSKSSSGVDESRQAERYLQ